MARLPLYANVVAANSVKVQSGDLNNTTPSLAIDVNNSGKKSLQVGDRVAIWDKDSYATPALDPNVQMARVTARSNKIVTLLRGEYGTPIAALAGRPSIAVAFSAADEEDTSMIEQLADLTKQTEVARTADFTLALADSGKVNVINADGKVGTLPATAPGLTMTFEIGTTGTANGVGEIGFAISPAAADAIDGAGATGVNNKDLLITKATARQGDRITLVGGAANKWVVSNYSTIHTREA